MRASAISLPDLYAPPLMVDRDCAEPMSLGAALIAGKKVPPDVLDLLRDDHRMLVGWFNWYESEPRAARRAWIVTNVSKALVAHIAIEERVFHPAAAAAIGKRQFIHHAAAEHREAKELIISLSESGTDADAQMSALRAVIERHVQREETELFPLVRQSALDRHETGTICAALRADLLFLLGPSSQELLKETPPMPISQDESRTQFVAGLRNVHGIARQCRSLVEIEVDRLESYDEVRAKMRAHLAEKDEQLLRVEQILEALGESKSFFKDTVGATRGAAASVGASISNDEIIKASLAAYGLAHVEAAAYETLLAMAEAAGYAEVMPLLQQSLSEERGMAAFIGENLRAISLKFMQLRSQGLPAGR